MSNNQIIDTNFADLLGKLTSVTKPPVSTTVSVPLQTNNYSITEINNDVVFNVDASFNDRVFVNGDVIMNSRLFLTNPNTLFVDGVLIKGTGDY